MKSSTDAAFGATIQRPIAMFACTAAMLVATAVPSRAQCASFDPRFYSFTGRVQALVTFDDGSGPALYAGGNFHIGGAVGIDHIAKWNGTAWEPLSTGTNDEVRALAVFDDGSGPALFAGGDFTLAGGVAANHVARWDGASWSALGSGTTGSGSVTGDVYALCVHDDGSGLGLYTGGNFTQAGSVFTSRIAKWDGTTWTSVGAGPNSGIIYALTVCDDGSGPALFIGGRFGSVGLVSASCVAKWNGSTWSGLNGGMSGSGSGIASVYALAAFDDGSGERLFAGGDFLNAGGVSSKYISAWNGSSWAALPASPILIVNALCVFDDGTGPALYEAGDTSVHRWSASGWGPFEYLDSYVVALAVFDDGVNPPSLHVGGYFAGHVARRDGPTWSRLDYGGRGAESSVLSMTVYDDGSGPALYAGGRFDWLGNVNANRVARWDGSQWSMLGAGLNGGTDERVYALAGYDVGTGPALYAAGVFTLAGTGSAGNIARWDGSQWSPLGSGTPLGSPGIFALAGFDDGRGPAVYAGGNFSSAGGHSALSIARWTGSSWQAVGGGIHGAVNTLILFDDGSGAALYAGGLFDIAGSASASNIAKWDGSSWSALGTGVDASIYALAVYDDGAGAQLYAAGNFTVAGGVGVNRIARWNGSAWAEIAPVPSDGFNATVYALTVFDDASGSSLCASGAFTTAGGTAAARIARWNGSTWSAFGAGLNDIGAALAAFDDGTDGAPDLYVGGYFGIADATPSAYIAEWHGCEPGTTYCFGDGIDEVVTAECPCGNFGEPGRGCANSNSSLGGARLWASGSTSPNTLVFHCEGMPNNSLATVMRGSLNNPGGVVFHDGVQCIAGAIIRFGQQAAGQDGNPPFTMAAPAIALAPGQTRYYQVHYRNPNAGFCPPGQFNFSNGYVLTW